MQIERHRTNRVGWLRAAVLGANDGLLSTSSLVLGVATAHGTHGSVLVAGLAGLVAGSMSMAAGDMFRFIRRLTQSALILSEKRKSKSQIPSESAKS